MSEQTPEPEPAIDESLVEPEKTTNLVDENDGDVEIDEDQTPEAHPDLTEYAEGIDADEDGAS